MKNKGKKIVTRTAMTLLLCVLTTMTTWAEVTYEWNNDTKTLTVGGTGEMTGTDGHQTNLVSMTMQKRLDIMASHSHPITVHLLVVSTSISFRPN